MLQHDLSFYDEDSILEESLERKRSLGEIVRDINYKQTLGREDTSIQRNVIHHIICGHPEGVTDLEICVITGFSRSSVCARRNEISGVVAVGVAKIIDDLLGDRLNTLWGIQ